MLKEDEILIQNKIDGNLTSGEEDKFKQLIAQSPEALKFYSELLSLNNALAENAEHGPSVDLTTTIMQTIHHKSKSIHLAPGRHQSFSTFLTNISAYAAILIIGLIIGGLVSYLVINPEMKLNQQSISGTIGKIPVNDSLEYNENNTAVRIQKFVAGQLILVVIEINTEEAIECRISDDLKEISGENILLLSKKSMFTAVSTEKQELIYIINGKTTFQIHTRNNNKLNIKFLNKNKLIKQFSI